MSSLIPIMMSLPSPEPNQEGEARANLGDGHIALDATYILPLLLAGAAFAKVAIKEDLSKTILSNKLHFRDICLVTSRVHHPLVIMDMDTRGVLDIPMDTMIIMVEELEQVPS